MAKSKVIVVGGDGRRTNGRMYTPNSEWRMNMDLYRMSPEELRMRDREMGVHYYEAGDYTGIGNNNRKSYSSYW